MTRLPPAILLMGPTAAGKTDLAIRLCQRLPCSLISVDSALVYRGMDIGTAKPDPAMLKEYPHRLIDIRDPAQPYSAAEFRHDALQAMAEISQAGCVPLLVGGTMLYFKVLLAGLAELPSADPAIRAQIDHEAAQHGWAYIHAQLAAVDPESAARIHPTDPQRLQRALEVFRATGQTLTERHQAERHQAGQQEATGLLPYRLLQVAMAPAHRATLHERIASRFDRMLSAGFVEEVQQLYARGDLHEGLPSMRAVGYRQVWSYLAGDLSYADMRERGIIATRQLAKRQLTWLRSWPDLNWMITDDTEQSHNDNLQAKEDFIVNNTLKLLESITR